MQSDIYNLPAQHRIIKATPERIEVGAHVGSYDGATDSRFRQQQAFRRSFEGTEENALPSYDRQRLILEGMDLERNNEVVAGLGERFPAYAIHTGMVPIPLTSDSVWNKLARDWFMQIYATTCDYRGLSDIYDQQRLIVRSKMFAGDSALLPLANGQIQPIEGQRICTPTKHQTDANVIEGFRFLKGRRIGVYICNRRDGGAIDREKYEYRKLSDGFFHQWQPKRFDQIRGIPQIAPLINKIRDYDETDSALLRKVKNAARQHMQNVSQEAHTTPNNLGSMHSVVENSDGTKEGFVKTKEGMVYFNPKGQKLELIESNTPHQHTVDYLKWQLQTGAACMNLPYAFLALMFESSYTAARAATMHASHTFEDINNFVAKTAMDPVWKWRIAMAIRQGDLPPAPVDENTGKSEWCKVKWSVPYMGSLDDEKRSRSDLNEVELGTESVTTLMRSRNRNIDDVWKSRKEELQSAAKLASELNTEFAKDGFKFSPADFTNSATPGGRQNEAPNPTSEDD